MSPPTDNLRKAAMMLICMGVEKAAQVFSNLTFDEVQVLADEMSHLGQIPRSTRRQVLMELRRRYDTSDQETATGDLAFVHRLLAETFGEDRASIIIDQLTQNKSARPFRSLRNVENHKILDILASEHPSVIALVIYYLPRDKAAQIMAGLAEAVRHEVVMRLVNLQTPVPHMVARLESMLTQKLSDVKGFEGSDERDFGTVSGARALVEILGRAHPSVEKRVYEFLQERDPALAEEVRKSMFVFEDLSRLEPRALQTVLREVSNQEIALALKGAPQELRDLVFTNVSANAAKMIREELELMGPVRLSQVEEAQQEVVETVRRLADAGTITMQAVDEEEMIM